MKSPSEPSTAKPKKGVPRTAAAASLEGGVRTTTPARARETQGKKTVKAKALAGLLERLRTLLGDAEIVVVDDGSADGTAPVARRDDQDAWLEQFHGVAHGASADNDVAHAPALVITGVEHLCAHQVGHVAGARGVEFGAKRDAAEQAEVAAAAELAVAARQVFLQRHQVAFAHEVARRHGGLQRTAAARHCSNSAGTTSHGTSPGHWAPSTSGRVTGPTSSPRGGSHWTPPT